MPITRRGLLAAVMLFAVACSTPDTGSHRSIPAWDKKALAEVVSYAQAQNTTGFLIVQNGATIADHKWPLPESAAQFKANFTYGTTATGALLEDVASQQKSFIAILIAVAVDKGLLDLDAPVASIIGAGWTSAPETEPRITVRHLLEMNSGLTEQLAADAEPGETFFYNTPAYAFLKPVLETITGKSLETLTAEWLTEPASMADTAWRQRPAAFANVGNPTGLVTTPRDIAIMGHLILDKGLAADGTRIVSETQLAEMLAPTSTNPAYAQLWWLNGGDHHYRPATDRRFPGPLIETAPSDLIAAQGAMDRKLFIVPSMNLIVVRTGQAADPGFNHRLWQLIMAAAPD